MKDIQQADTTYQKFARYYDAYVQGFQEDLPLYLTMCRQANRILEVGCGTGRVLHCLLESGHSADGVDISDEMLAIAAAKLSGFLKDRRLRLLKHNLCQGPLPEKYQRILVTFYTFNYLTDETEARNFLANLRRSMTGKALLLLDLFYPLTLAQPEKDDQWTIKSFPAGDNRIQLHDKRVLYGNLEERLQRYIEPNGAATEILTVRRFYSKAEIFRLLQETGYDHIQLAEGYRPDGFHLAEADEKTTAGFCVAAENAV